MLPPRLRKASEKRVASEARYFPPLPPRLLAVARWASSSVAELGLEESVSGRRRRMSGEIEEAEEEELPFESREAVVAVSVDEEEVEEDERRSVRTMEMRGERWRGRSWPL